MPLISEQLPPEGIRILVKAPNFSHREIEAALLRTKGRIGLRWAVYTLFKDRRYFMHRGWQPHSWRFIDGG